LRYILQMSSSLRPLISIVAPCFNEEQGLGEFVRRCVESGRSACEAQGGRGGLFELVLVNDGSRDGTWSLMQRLAREYPELVCVNLSRNHGHQLALTAGLHVCRGERVMIIDADLQDPPELLGAMLSRMDEGYDVVYGQRRKRVGETKMKLLTAALFYRIIDRLTDVPIPRDTGDFRLMSRRSLDVLMGMPERHRFIRGMVSWIGFPQAALEYDRDSRFAGETKYPYRKMMRFAMDAITAFSTRPLAWASTAGFFFALVAAGLFVYSLFSWLVWDTAPGWTSLMAAMALFSSVQLVVLGIFGEYLGRLCDQSKGRPLFIIESIVAGAGESRPRIPEAIVEVRSRPSFVQGFTPAERGGEL
jgi:polyisoprenyl-phosphate glycosyltransferase